MDFLVSAHLGAYEHAVAQRLAQLQRDAIIPRIWQRDYTVWKPEPDEIANRLGWLIALDTMQRELPAIHQLVDAVRAEGYRHVRVLGMGGASLVAEVFQTAFGVAEGYLDCAVIDSTHPDAVLAARHALDLSKTLFIVSIKKYALETVSLFKYFYNAVLDAVGTQEAGAHFVAITDPGVWVNDLAADYSFRHVCLNDPDIGGRYSPLTYVGLLPAALLGVDVDRFVSQAQPLQQTYGANVTPDAHPGAWLGAVLGELALQGRDKLTLITSRRLAGFADWAEQLIAESTGKGGTGILPVVHERVVAPEYYGADRVFVSLDLAGDSSSHQSLKPLIAAGYPVLQFGLQDHFDLAEQFYLWCFATAVAGHCLGINPFDQPNVETTKVQTRKLLDADTGGQRLGAQQPVLIENQIAVYADHAGETLAGILQAFLSRAEPGAYIALQAYLPPTETHDAALQALRQHLLKRTRLATTLGYGPRFLHSTGQLHKGDQGHGYFIQLTSDAERNVSIPDQAGARATSLSFDTLIKAQARGDAQALTASGRRVIRFHLAGDVAEGLQYLAQLAAADVDTA